MPQAIRGDAGGELTGSWDDGDVERFVERIEARVEALAPGFRSLVRARHVLTPRELEARDENLVGGALNGGTAQLHQQLFFRPTPGLGRPETPVARPLPRLGGRAPRRRRPRRARADRRPRGAARRSREADRAPRRRRGRPGRPPALVASTAMEAERCLRCAAAMEWRHGTWQCPRCRFKLGCCEGEPQTSCERALLGRRRVLGEELPLEVERQVAVGLDHLDELPALLPELVQLALRARLRADAEDEVLEPAQRVLVPCAAAPPRGAPARRAPRPTSGVPSAATLAFRGPM